MKDIFKIKTKSFYITLLTLIVLSCNRNKEKNMPDDHKTYTAFTKALNNTLKEFEINTCLRKIHFIAQIYWETGYFSATKEKNAGKQLYYPYIGRGFMQLTGTKKGEPGLEDSRTHNATALWIAHCVNNALKSIDRQLNRNVKSFKELFKTGYSSIDSKDKGKVLKDTDESSIVKGSRAALISVLIENRDPPDNAMFWDGMDLVSDYGNKESILQHPKFRQYQSVYISKVLLDKLIDFWSIDSNKRKVNAKRKILEISPTNDVSKNKFGAYIFNEDFFVGATSSGEVAKYRLIATGCHSGTLFYKPELPGKK